MSDLVQEGTFILYTSTEFKDSSSHLYNAKGVCIGSFGKIFNEVIQ